MTKDLTVNQDRPLWPLSSYGPAKQVPNVIQGLDESPEELRVRAFAAAKGVLSPDYVRAFSILTTELPNLLVDQI
jgi:nucleoporin NUP42